MTLNIQCLASRKCITSLYGFKFSVLHAGMGLVCTRQTATATAALSIVLSAHCTAVSPGLTGHQICFIQSQQDMATEGGPITHPLCCRYAVATWSASQKESCTTAGRHHTHGQRQYYCSAAAQACHASCPVAANIGIVAASNDTEPVWNESIRQPW